MTSIWTVTHTHKHGTDFYAFASEELALTHLGNLLLTWVEEWVAYAKQYDSGLHVFTGIVQQIALGDVPEALNIFSEYVHAFCGWDEDFVWEEAHVSTTCAPKAQLLAQLAATLDVKE